MIPVNDMSMFKRIPEGDCYYYECTLCNEKVSPGIIHISNHFFNCPKNTQKTIYRKQSAVEFTKSWNKFHK